MKKVLGGLQTQVLGGDDGHGAGSGPAVVLLHGFGAPGDDLVGLAEALDLPEETRVLFPEAPLSLGELFGLPPGPGGPRAWWMIDMVALERARASGEHRDLTKQCPPGMRDARDALEAMLDEARRTLGIDPARTVLGGFSQGAMLATELALETSRELAGLVMLSGTIMNEASWIAKLPARRGLPVFQSHGRHDDILPFDIATRFTGLMREAGLEVDAVTFSGGHEIPRPVVAGLSAFLGRALRPG